MGTWRKNLHLAALVMRRLITYSPNKRSPGGLIYKERRWERRETFSNFQVMRLKRIDEYWKRKRMKLNEKYSESSDFDSFLHLKTSGYK